uniref:Uncharacterized protein n=1 Tax=Cacopsylla melanoneura TaxID=428564 RepID=A0A8D8VV35_9HEMI
MGVIVELNSNYPSSELCLRNYSEDLKKANNRASYHSDSVKPLNNSQFCAPLNSGQLLNRGQPINISQFCDIVKPVESKPEDKCVKDYLKSKMKGLKKLKRKMGFGKSNKTPIIQIY